MIKNLQNYLNTIATNENLAHSETKIEQKASREIKEKSLELLLELFKNLENDNIKVERTAEGVAIALDNAEVGFIPLVVDISVKNLDYDISEEHIDYLEHLAEIKAKEEQKAKEKAEKIAKSKAEREAKAKAKAEKRAKPTA